MMVLIGVALIVAMAGFCGAIGYGSWRVSQDCHEWANSNGYQLVQDDWWAKTGGCVARKPDGGELIHSEELGNKAIGWAWQSAIFAAGTLPAVGIVAFIALRRRRRRPGLALEVFLGQDRLPFNHRE
jgi:hypothetical protein